MSIFLNACGAPVGNVLESVAVPLVVKESVLSVIWLLTGTRGVTTEELLRQIQIQGKSVIRFSAREFFAASRGLMNSICIMRYLKLPYEKRVEAILRCQKELFEMAQYELMLCVISSYTSVYRNRFRICKKQNTCHLWISQVFVKSLELMLCWWHESQWTQEDGKSWN